MQYRENKMLWKEIYWKMWARTKVFKCKTCKLPFRPIDAKHQWRRHPRGLKYRYGENYGVYEWWNLQVQKFDVGISAEQIPGSLDETPRLETLKEMSAPETHGCELVDHMIDINDKNYLTPIVDPTKDHIKNWGKIWFIEDLEHFWRNKDIILKQSKIPDVTSVSRLHSLDREESDNEADEVFIETESRYLKEKLREATNVPDKLIKIEGVEGKPLAMSSKRNKAKMIQWRLDALRYDDRDAMKSLINTLKSKHTV